MPQMHFEKFIGEVGSAEISVRSQVVGTGAAGTTTITLNHVVVDTIF
jgi:hypothetical protein